MPDTAVAPIPSSPPLNVGSRKPRTGSEPNRPQDAGTEATYQLRSLFDDVESIQAIRLDPSTAVKTSFERLNVAGVDYQGQLSCAYGQAGGAAGVEITVNLASLIPFLDVAGVELEIGVEGGVTRMKESMLVVQRFPTVVYAPPATSNTEGVQPFVTRSAEVLVTDLSTEESEVVGDTSVGNASRPVSSDEAEEWKRKKQQPVTLIGPPPPVVAWETRLPINLIAFNGLVFQGAMKLTAKAGYKLPFPDLGDVIEVEVSASVEGSVQGQMESIRLEAGRPDHFASPSDSELLVESRLRQVVNELLFTLSEEELNQIGGFVAKRMRELFGIDAVQPSESFFYKLFRLTGLKEKWDKYRKIWEDLSKDQLEEAAAISGRIETLCTRIAEATKGRALTVDEEGLLDELRRYTVLLERFALTRQRELSLGARKRGKVFDDSLTAFSLFKYQFIVSGSAEATVGVKIGGGGEEKGGKDGEGENENGEDDGGLQVEAAAKVGASHTIQRVSYRLQSSSNAKGRTLVFTQDAYIQYHTTEVEISAEAKAAWDDWGATAEASRKPVLYNSMSYLAVRYFWIHPHAAEVHNTKDVNLLQRSGFSYGMSVSLVDLLGCIEQSPSTAAGKRLIKMAKQLRVTEDDVRSFLHLARVYDFCESPQNGATADRTDKETRKKEAALRALIPNELFIESTFAFNPHDQLNVKVVGVENGSSKVCEPVSSCKAEISEFKIDRFKYRLESLRLRARIQDLRESSEELFKLGLSLKVIEVKANYTKEQHARLEGFFDLYVHWYGDKQLNSAEMAKAAQESGVPPVVLIHQ